MYCITDEVLSSTGPDLKEGSRDNLFLKGFLGSSEYSAIYVSFKSCSNETGGVVCKPPDEIKRKIDKVYFGGIYTNTYFDPKNLESPLQKNLEWFVIKSFSYLRKELRISLQRGILNSDMGRINEQNHVYNFESLSSLMETQSSAPDEDIFITFVIQLDKTERTYSRKYKKFQDVTGEVGGSMQIIFFVFSILMKKITNLLYRNELYESLLKTTNAILGLDKAPDKKAGTVNKLLSFINLKPLRRIYNRLKSVKFDIVEHNMDLRSVLNQSIRIDCLINLIFPEEKKDQFEYYYLVEKRRRLVSREQHRSLTFLYDRENPTPIFSPASRIPKQNKANLSAFSHDDGDLFSRRLDLAIRASLVSLGSGRNKMVQSSPKVFEPSKAVLKNNLFDIKGAEWSKSIFEKDLA